ncbi:MBL fold metallo-hydrolase [Parvularcula lutaonensis]|uniref:beta-lactamase n=1 Tax=Parvularcula lutaonensis TaxID=491923 RepID=A0ABV7MDY6_9PROT|nr:MBL fold metallo-hydrolase [Parvularcula lutaonensis]GGY53653.1 cyclase [Parvularcula lutaonensis]
MTLTISALTALASLSLAQRDLSSVEITSEEAAPGVHVLYGAGGNIGLHFGDDAVFIIDDQFAPLTGKIIAKVRELSGDDIDFVLNTHYHGDHTGGNENLGEAGALIFGHDNVRTRVLEGQNPANAPVVTFSKQQSFHINGDTVRAVHIPNAHTDGDAIVVFEKANVIHTGDTMFEESMGSFPYIDLAGGGSINGAIEAARTTWEMSDENTVIIPGHGRLTDKAGAKAYHDMLVAIRDRVQRMIDDGKSKSEIVAAKPASAYAESRTGGFISEDRFVETVYDSLTAE